LGQHCWWMDEHICQFTECPCFLQCVDTIIN
jgi:hypothetical protein